MPRLHPPRFRSRLSTERAVRLLGLLDALGVGAQFERSFKLVAGTLQANRFVLAITKRTIARDPEPSVLRLCEGLGMPEAGLRMFREHLPEADVLGFGLEEDDTTCMVKAYVEFRRRYAEATRQGREGASPYVSHRGVKWDAADPGRHVITEYTCFPALTADDMLDRVARLHYAADDGGTLPIVRGVVTLATRKVGGDKLLYLEAAEAQTPRASFDINVYGADMKLRDVHDALAALFDHYGIPPTQFRELYEILHDATLGHLAGGTDRRGREFVTVYVEE